MRRTVRVVALRESVTNVMIVIARLRVVTMDRVVAMDREVATDRMVAMDRVDGPFRTEDMEVMSVTARPRNTAMIARLRVDILPIAQIRVAAMDRAVATDVLVTIARSREDATRSEVRIDTMVGIVRRQEIGIVRGKRLDLATM